MAVQIIPLIPNAAYNLNATLEDIAWEMFVRWNFVDEAYYLNMSSTETGTDLKGLKLVGGSNILGPHAVVELGKMYIVDTEGQFTNPTFDLIGDRYKLLYVPKADIDDYPL